MLATKQTLYRVGSNSPGVHIVYGLLGLKTHSKIALVVRREDESIRRHVHLSTGNYTPVTAHVYTDSGLLTCDEGRGRDASDLGLAAVPAPLDG